MFFETASQTSQLFQLAPLIVFLPLAGMLVNIIFGGRLPEKVVGTIASIAAGLAFVVSVLLAVALAGQPRGSGYRPLGAVDEDWRLGFKLGFPGGYALGDDDVGGFWCGEFNPHLFDWLYA